MGSSLFVWIVAAFRALAAHIELWPRMQIPSVITTPPLRRDFFAATANARSTNLNGKLAACQRRWSRISSAPWVRRAFPFRPIGGAGRPIRLGAPARPHDLKTRQLFKPSDSRPAPKAGFFMPPDHGHPTMIIVLKPEAPAETARELMEKIEAKGLKPLHMPGAERVVLGALGDERLLAELALDSHPMVESLKPILAPYKLVSREMHPHDTIVRFGRNAIGGRGFTVIAGPCAVESREQMRNTAIFAKTAGAHGLRAGAYKPRTSPYAFQGHGLEGLKILREVGDDLDLPVVTEVMETADVDTVAEYADALQIGARNMQNFSLLKAVGKCGKPVLLKRGMSAKVEELLLAAEYLLAAGNEQVMLCERGIR